ncbi:c-type cytochrome domain-containing protein [Sphingobacterium nematocida]|nr:c-type cytochrome domain-containing protein [Sphingobacterium nematocida]
MATKRIYVETFTSTIPIMGQFFEELGEFIGRAHPLLVHLPIGMLVVAFFMAVLAKREKYKEIHVAIPVVLFFGSMAAILASIAGYLLSLRGGYEQQTLDFHQWLGIAVAVISVSVYWMYRKKWSYRFLVFSLLFLLIGATGHFGGTLTHGEGYFKEAIPTVIKDMLGLKSEEFQMAKIENVQEAALYQEIIAPILMQRCASCHGERKKEGGLAIHSQEFLLKGGDGGVVLKPGKMPESELYARLVLPVGHEKRMPPKGRTPITAEQIKLIGWWITEGASFTKKVNQTNQSPEIKTLLAQLEEGGNEAEQLEYADLPEGNDLPEEFVRNLQAKGIKVLPVAVNSPYVAINAINYPEFSDKDLEDLLQIKDNIVQLKLARTAVSDAAMASVVKMPYLRKLHLEHTKLSDEGLHVLKGSKSLRYINLFGTAISDQGLTHLGQLQGLKQIYAYQTKVTAKGVEGLKALDVELYVDSGKYQLPFLNSDTVKY